MHTGETHKVPQASKHGSSEAQDPQGMKFSNSHNLHKICGRGLDMVLYHSVFIPTYKNDTSWWDTQGAPVIMALPCEAVNLYDTILEDIWGPQKSGQGGWG